MASKNTQPETQLAKPAVGSELARLDPEQVAVIVPVQYSPDEMRAIASQEMERRQVVLEIVRDTLEEGTDYGPNDPRSNKNTLLKPGAEKMLRLFKCHAHFEGDSKAKEMLGNPQNVSFYSCDIIDNVTGAVVGEGHGACRIDAAHDENKAGKKAKKRALVDACLYAFCLSEFFTQDMEGKAGQLALKLMQAKRELIEKAEKYRSGVEAEISTQMWIVGITANLYGGRKVLNTPGECDRVASEFGNFDKASGQKKGQGKPKAKTENPLATAKKALLAKVAKARKGIASSLSDGGFVVEVAKATYDGRTTLNTVAECQEIGKVFTAFDLDTCERIPDA